jgi:hypothetical protein
MKHGKKFFVGGLMNLAAGLGTAGYGLYQENQAKRKMAQADNAAQGPIRSQAARQRIAQQETDAQSAIDSTLRAQATAAEQIAQQGGSRALVSATPGLIRATDLASQNAIDQFGQKNAAIRRVEESNALATQRADAKSNFDRLAKAADAGRKTTMMGIGQSLSGLADIAGSFRKKGGGGGGGTGDAESPVADAATTSTSTPPLVSTPDALKEDRLASMANIRNDVQGGLLDFAKGQKKAITDRVLGDLNQPYGVGIPEGTNMIPEVNVSATPLSSNVSAPSSPQTYSANKPGINILDEEVSGSGIQINPMAGRLTPGQIASSGFGQPTRTLDDVANYAAQLTGQNSLNRMSQLNAQIPTMQLQEEELDRISAPQAMEEGGLQEKIEKTPGEFDHDDNPIDIVQEGAKIGEMTGGEYIFNPEQAAEMRKLSEEGDSELHQFIRNLLSKEQFQ